MIAADLGRRERLGVADVGVADDRQVIAERLERREAARRQIEVAADRCGRPQVLLDADRRAAGRAVHHLDARQPHLGGGRLVSNTRPAGTIASRNGSATVTPMPFSTARREICFFVMNIRPLLEVATA